MSNRWASIVIKTGKGEAREWILQNVTSFRNGGYEIRVLNP